MDPLTAASIGKRQYFIQAGLNSQLLTAVYNRDIVEVNKSLQDGASVNATCRETGTTALQLAVILGNVEAATYLINKRADIRQRDFKGRQAVHFAAARCEPDLLALLLNAVQNDAMVINSRVTSAREQDVSSTCLDWLDHKHDLIIKEIPDILMFATPLHIAAQRLNSESLCMLLKRNARVDLTDGRRLNSLDVLGELDPSSLHTARAQDSSSETDSDETLSSRSSQELAYELINRGAKLTVCNELCYGSKCHQRKMTTTCLHAAVKCKDIKLLNYLLDEGACMNTLNENGLNALHLAVSEKLLEPLRALLMSNKYAKVLNSYCSKGNTPLHIAVGNEWFAGACLLLEAGADVTLGNRAGDTVIHVAARSLNHSLLQEILTIEESTTALENYNEQEQIPLVCAAIHGQYSNVNLLLTKGREELFIKPDLTTMVHFAAEHGDFNLLDDLIHRYPDLKYVKSTAPYKFGYTALHLAAHGGSLNCVNILINNGCDLFTMASLRNENFGPTALHVAASQGHVNVVEFIIQTNRQTLCAESVQKVTPLHTAAAHGNIDCIKSMLLKGANLGASVQYEEGFRLTTFDLIDRHIDNPDAFLKDVFDSFIIYNEDPINKANSNVTVKYDILQPLHGEQQEQVLETLLSCNRVSLKEELLLHPVIDTFVYLKWKKVCVVYILMMMVYILFTTSLTFIVYTNKTQNDAELQIHTKKALLVCKVFFYTSLMLIWVQESLLAVRLKYYYMREPEFWMKIISSVLSLYVVYFSPTVSAVRLSAFAVLMAWMETQFLFSYWPSSLGLYILMFFNVAKHIFKVLASFILAILGFTLAFMIQFPSKESFKNMWEALMKVLFMCLELDHNGLFDNDEEALSNRVMGQLLSLVFMILVAITFINLLIGLAVTNIAALEKKGHAKQLAKQIDFINMVELIFFYVKIRQPNLLLKGIKRWADPLEDLCLYPLIPSRETKHLPEKLRQAVISIALNKQSREERLHIL